MALPLFAEEVAPRHEKRRKQYSTRDTSTGASTEMIVASALHWNGYQVSGRKKNTVIARSFGINHTPDWLARNGDREVIVEVKYQGSAGSIYIKILGEIVRLVKSMRTCNGRFAAAYIVIVSDKIPRSFMESLFRQDYLSEIPEARNIHCLSLDTFSRKCTRREL